MSKNEVDELLLRHYQDKSLIDEWASWWQKYPLLYKSAIAGSIMCIAGFLGAIIELSILCILLASGILYFLHKTLIHHAKHRRASSERCVTEIRDTTRQLDEMSAQLKTISHDMIKPLERINAHAETMANNNNQMEIQTKQLMQQQETLRKLTDATCEQQAHAHLIQAAEKLTATIQLANASIDCADRSRHHIESNLNLDKTIALHQQIELDIEKISNDLHPLIQLDCNSQREFENPTERTRHALALVQELNTPHVVTRVQVIDEAAIAAALIDSELVECDRDYELSRVRTQNTLAFVQKLRLTAPLPNARGSDSDSTPHQTSGSETAPFPNGRRSDFESRPLGSEESGSDSDVAYKMSRRKTRNTLAMVRARRAQLEQEHQNVTEHSRAFA